MDDLDRALARLAGAPVPAALDDVEARVLARIGTRPVVRQAGIVNAWLLVGVANLPNLTATVYGQLLIAKLVLFGAMLTLASFNRFRLTPAFERSITAVDHHGALRGLRRSLAVEASCAVAILALVAWLGTLEPPASAM